MSAGIPGSLICTRAQISRGRLSEIERGYVIPSADETSRIVQALDELTLARKKVEKAAAEVGWPGHI